VLIDTIGFGIVIPVLPKLLVELTGESVSEVAAIGGWLVAAFAVAQFLCGPLLGNLGDRFGRRPVLLGSMAAFGLNYLLMAVAPTLAWLFVGRALAGAAGAIYAPANAYIADITPPAERARRFALTGAAFGLGFIIGPAIGGLLSGLGPRAPFYVAAALAGLNFVFGLFALPESLAPENRRAFNLARANPFGALMALRKHGGVLAVIASIFLWFLAFQVYPTTWAFFVKVKFDWSEQAIGATLAYSGLLMALVQAGATGRLVKSFGERRTAIIGLVSGIAGMALYAFIPQGWMIYAVATVACLQGVAGASMNAIISQRTPANAQGELQGGVASANGLGMVIGPLLLATTLSAAAAPGLAHPFPGAAFALAAAISLCALFVFAWATREKSESGNIGPRPFLGRRSEASLREGGRRAVSIAAAAGAPEGARSGSRQDRAKP
jgi:DHA1 family tetracycline resistance protein-like MFS transporter